MTIVFVVGPCLSRRNVCKYLLPMAGINLRCVNLYDHLIRGVPPEAELEEKNISLAVSDRFVIDKLNKIIRRHKKTLPVDTVLVINGFPYSESQADYLAAAYKKAEYKIGILHVEPQVYCRCHDTSVHRKYENLVRPAALRLAEDFPVFTLQYEEDRNMREFMLPSILRIFKKFQRKKNPKRRSRHHSEVTKLLREVTRSVRVPNKHLLFKLVVEHPKILLECPHVSPLLIGA